MKKALWFMVILAVLLPGMALAQEGTSGGPSLGDSYYPELGNGGYDVQHYTLDINYDMPRHLLEGVATIEAVATQDLSDFNFDIIGLMIDTVTVNDTPAEHTRERTELTIIPADMLPAEEAFTVQIVYAGLPTGIQPEQIPVNMGWNHIGDSVYVASEPVGSSTWYPVNEHPLDKATYTINLTVPKGYESAVTGLRTAETINDDGSISTTWELSAPTASYLVSINIGDFVRIEEEGPDGLLIRNYFPPDLAEDAAYDFGRTAEMIEYFSTLYGPYPFDVYGVVVTDNDTGFALENQTLSLFGVQHVDGLRSSELTVAHELAHQWFGDSVSLSDWSDIWLNEGFATYSQFLWLEHSAGETVFNEQMQGIYAYLVPMSAALPPIGTPPPNNLFNGAVYLRGAMTLHALRQKVGEETGIAIMKAYFAAYQNSNTTTADFIAIAEEVSGQDLSDFFDAWLYQETLPPIPELGWDPDTFGD